jgi:nucleotide-binding universal stress UspA family protein
MAIARAHTFHPQKLLVPVDFSLSSQEALEAALDLAETFASELYLLHVVPMFPVVPTLDGPTCVWPEDEFVQEARDRAEKRLTALKEEYKSRGIMASYSVETGDDVVGNIMRIAEREHVDLLVISTHGISGWRPMVFGSIAEKVIKLAGCPVLLLRARPLAV